MNFRDVYSPLIVAMESSGYFVTGMPFLTGGDRIVCCGQQLDGGSLTGNSFWLAERDSRWFLGAWGGCLYHVADVETACEIAIDWLSDNHTQTDADVPENLKVKFKLKVANDSELESVL